jgi:hypothetical protein
VLKQNCRIQKTSSECLESSQRPDKDGGNAFTKPRCFRIKRGQIGTVNIENAKKIAVCHEWHYDL